MSGYPARSLFADEAVWPRASTVATQRQVWGAPRFKPRRSATKVLIFHGGHFRHLSILGGSKYDHVTPLIRDDLHWLRVPERVTFKLSARLQGTARPGSSVHQVDVCISLVVHGKIIAALGVKGPPHTFTHSARVRQVRLRIRRSNSLNQPSWHCTKCWIH